MTGSNLAPDTAREISGLKRRVTDLERMLDRVRRDAAREPATDYATPWASFAGHYETVPDGTLTTLAPSAVPVTTDPTGHIHLDHGNLGPGHGWFMLLRPGYYELGATLQFADGEGAGHRTLAIWRTVNGTPGTPLDVLTVDRAPGVDTVLSGSRFVYADRSATIEWRVAAGHSAGTDLDVRCRAFWARWVIGGDPPFYGCGGEP